MTCREFTSFIGDYLAGELDAEVRLAFDHHVSVCPNCVQYLADYQRSIALGQGVYDPTDTVPADVPADLVTAILTARRDPGSG